MQQREDAAIWKASGVDRLEKYKSFNTIDGLVKLYPSYKHSEISQLPYEAVMTMLGFNKENTKIGSNYNTIKSKTN